MKRIEAFNIIIELKQIFIKNIKPCDVSDNGKSFTKKRRLTLERVMLIILQGITMALQIQLDDFFEGIGCKGESVSKQAFSKARTNLDPKVIKSSFELTTKTLCECEDLKYYKGRYRLCAIDGSDLALDNAPELKEYFGCSGSAKNATTAMASLCYDPLNNIILDAGLYPYSVSERDAARKNIDAVEALPIPKKIKNLYIFDRGYPSKDFFSELIDTKKTFLMRVRKKFNNDFEGVTKSGRVKFFYNGKRYIVRIFKVLLDSGEIETIVTNITDRYISEAEIKGLYFERWGIETKFDSLKNKLELENMSGRRKVTVYQDFWAKLDIANTMAALQFATDEAIEVKTADKDNKYQQTTNENRLVSNFSKRYLDLLGEPDSDFRAALFDMLVSDISRYPVEVKPDRKFSRKNPRKIKYCDRRKRAMR